MLWFSLRHKDRFYYLCHMNISLLGIFFFIDSVKLKRRRWARSSITLHQSNILQWSWTCIAQAATITVVWSWRRIGEIVCGAVFVMFPFYFSSGYTGLCSFCLVLSPCRVTGWVTRGWSFSSMLSIICEMYMDWCVNTVTELQHLLTHF